jgi:hypothetical protein
MRKIYSQVSPEVLLHIIGKLQDIRIGRSNISPEAELLQLAHYKLAKGKKVEAHRHLQQERTTIGTQESWIVFRGAIEAEYYDLDGSSISKEVLYAGDYSITFRGGHSLKSIEDNTIVFEHKNGPYLGLAADKEAITNQSTCLENPV